MPRTPGAEELSGFWVACRVPASIPHFFDAWLYCRAWQASEALVLCGCFLEAFSLQCAAAPTVAQGRKPGDNWRRPSDLEEKPGDSWRQPSDLDDWRGPTRRRATHPTTADDSTGCRCPRRSWRRDLERRPSRLNETERERELCLGLLSFVVGLGLGVVVVISTSRPSPEGLRAACPLSCFTDARPCWFEGRCLPPPPDRWPPDQGDTCETAGH